MKDAIEWARSVWDDAYLRALGRDKHPSGGWSRMEKGMPWLSVSWTKWAGRRCWMGWHSGTVPMTMIVEDYRVDAERRIAELEAQ